MKTTMKLDEVPSIGKHIKNGLIKLMYKTANMGLYSTDAKNIEIVDRLTGTTEKLPNPKPISIKQITNLDYAVSGDLVSETLVGLLYEKKKSLKATKGKNKDRYVVIYDVV